MRQVSDDALSSINASETGEVWLAMLVLTHPNFSQTIRLVSNTEPVTHQGEEFAPFPFAVQLPDEGEDVDSVVRFSVSNIGRDFIGELRSIEGPVSGSVFWIIASRPDLIEVGPMDLEIAGFQYNDLQISGNMTIEPVGDRSFGSLSMDPFNAPGLF